MTVRRDPILQHVRRVAARSDRAELTDGQLLGRFITDQDAAAFEVLVRRHGPMVLGVCRRMLRHPQDAEDAFQATFLVLARKAATVSPRERVGNWLYGVAHTTALRARVANARRRGREKQVRDMPEPAVIPPESGADLSAVLDEELSRLPDRYRLPVVLCDLEGRKRREVARQLGIPEGTLSSRLTTARRTLARRLARRGLAVSGASLAGLLAPGGASACVPAALLAATVRSGVLIAAGGATVGVGSATITTLMEGVLKTMVLSKLKTFLVVLVTAGVFGLGAGALLHSSQAGEKARRKEGPPARADRSRPPNRPQTEEKPRPDAERLQGTWKLIAMVEDGKEQTGGSRRVGDWTFKDSTVRFRTQPQDQKEGTAIEFLRFRLNESTHPRSIDLVAWDKEFDDADMVIRGVYSLRGDRLTICCSFPPSNGRPTSLQSRKGSATTQFVLRKLSPAEKKETDRAARAAGDGTAARSGKERSLVMRSNQRALQIPFATDPANRAGVKEVRLWVSPDRGRTWYQAATAKPDERAFSFRAPKDGLYWFAVQTVGRDGKLQPKTEDVRPDLQVLVETGPVGPASRR